MRNQCAPRGIPLSTGEFETEQKLNYQFKKINSFLCPKYEGKFQAPIQFGFGNAKV